MMNLRVRVLQQEQSQADFAGNKSSSAIHCGDELETPAASNMSPPKYLPALQGQYSSSARVSHMGSGAGGSPTNIPMLKKQS